MSTEKTWVVDPARAVSGTGVIATYARWFLWYFIYQLVGVTTGGVLFTSGKWAIRTSCNGVTCGVAGDGVDHLGGSTFSAGNFLRAAAGSSHTWIELFNSTLGIYLLIDYSTGQDYLCNFVWSRTAFSGGTINTAPTASGSDTWSSLQFCHTSGAAGHVEMTLASDGSFHIAGSRDTTNKVNFFFFCWILLEQAQTANGDANNDVGNAHWGAQYSDTQVMLFVTLNTSNAGILKQKDYLGTTSHSAAIIWLDYIGNGSSPFQTSIAATDAIRGNTPSLPIYVADLTVGSVAKRGRIADVQRGTTQPDNADGTINPPTGNCVSVKVGDVWLPRPLPVSGATTPLLY